MNLQPKHKRIRGRRLQEYRAQWFSLHPLCAECDKNGKVRLATQLDHIVALDNGGTDFDQPGNRQGLCDDCHEVKTARDLGHRSRRAIGLDGFPIDGGGSVGPGGEELETGRRVEFSRPQNSDRGSKGAPA